jgi:hypothetical protein
VVLNTGHWQTHTSTIRNHTAGTSEFDYEEETDFEWLVSDGHAKYFVEGCEAALDTEGEWVYGTSDPTRLLFRPPVASDVDHSSFDFSSLRGKNQSYALAFDDCEAVSVVGLTFFATTLMMWESPSSAVTDCEFLYPSYSRRALGEVGRSGISTGLTARPLDDPVILPQFADTPNGFQGGGITKLDSGVAGMWFGTKFSLKYGCNLTLARNTFWRTDGMAVYLRGCGGALIEDNSFKEISYSGVSGSSEIGVIALNTSPVCTVRRNFFGTSGPSETIVLGKEGTLVELNYFTDCGHCQEDGFAVHAYTDGQNYAMVRQNWVIDSILGGIRFDAASAGIFGENGTVLRNVAYGTSHAWSSTDRGYASQIAIKGLNHTIRHNTVMESGHSTQPLLPRVRHSDGRRLSSVGILQQ